MKKGWLLALVCVASLPVKAEDVAASKKVATEVAPAGNTVVTKAENIAPLEKAKAFVDTYISMTRSYDAGLADLYSDNAVIKQHQIDPKGKKTEVILSTVKYKETVRKDFAEHKMSGKMNGQYIYFSNVEVKPEGNAFRATGKVHSQLKPVKRPFSLLVRQLESGGWQVIEESTTRLLQ